MKDTVLAAQYETRLGELESKRQALVNEYNKLNTLISEVIKAAKEYTIFIDKAMAGEYSKDMVTQDLTPAQRAQLAGLKSMLERAIVMYQTGVSKKITRQEFWQMPEEPKTNDMFFDGEHYYVYYLGRWNEANPVKG